MRKVLLGAASAGILFLGAAPSAMAVPERGPNERACANGHGTMHAHMTVRHETRGNEMAHSKIPHFCMHGGGH